MACRRLPLLSRLGEAEIAAGKIEAVRDQSVEHGGLHPNLLLPTQRAAWLAGDMPMVAMMAGTSTLMMSASLLSLSQMPPAGPVEAEISVEMVLVP